MFTFPLDISENAEVGTVSLTLEVEYSILNEYASPPSHVKMPPVTLDLDVPVYGRPILSIEVDKYEIPAGSETPLNVKIRNVGSGAVIDLNVAINVRGKTSMTGTMETPIVFVKKDNIQHFDRIEAGSEESFTVLLGVDKDAVGPYSLDFTLTYRDEWGKLYSETRSLGIYVSSKLPSSQILVSSYKVEPETVYKGEDFTLTLTVENTGDSTAQQVLVQLTPPQGFSTLTPSALSLGSLKPGEARTITYKLKASPTAKEGVIYTFSVDIGYVDELGIARTSRSLLGIPLHGTVELVTYDVEVSPASPGAPLTVTFTLLNRGTTTASYTTITVVSERPFKPLEEPTYIGDLDPNAPLPVSLKAMVKPDTAEGVYKLKVKVYYKDEYNEDHTEYLTFPVKVLKATSPIPTLSKEEKTPSLVDIYIYVIAGVVVAAALIAGLAWRRKKQGITEEKI